MNPIAIVIVSLRAAATRPIVPLAISVFAVQKVFEITSEVLKRMFEGKLGMLYRDIYMGDIRNVHGQDESRADTLLFNGLAYYTKGNAEQMRRILTSSPRYNQRGAKWHKRVSGDTTYLDYQIEDSISYSQKR